MTLPRFRVAQQRRQGFIFYYSCAYGKCSRFSGERSEPRGWGPSDGLGPSDCTKKKIRAYCYHPISEKLAWPSALSPPLLLMRGQLARTTSYDGLRSAARFLRRKAPGRHAAMLFDPPEQRCFHRSSNAERAAEQAGHLLQVTQSASSRLSSSAVQAGTTSRTTRAAWTAAPTSSRADGNHLVQHGRGATVSAAVGCRSDATACACADGAVQFYASIGARMPHADTRVPTHRAAAMRCRWSCGCSPYAPVRGYVPCAVCSDFASWVGFLSERLRPARGEKT